MKNIEELKKIKEALEVLINESEKPKFEVGKWYKSHDNTRMWFIKNLIGADQESYGFYNFSNWVDSGIRSSCKSEFRLATKSEVQEALTKEAIKRGFKEGVKFKTCLGNIRTGLGEFEFLSYDNILRFKSCEETGRCPNIFKNGEWAELIKTKTIDEIATSIRNFHFSTSGSLEENLIKYFSKEENKQDIINALNNL